MEASQLGRVSFFRLACPTFDTCQEVCSVRKGFCQEGILSGRNFVRQEFCQEGILSGRNFVRKGFCQERILAPSNAFVRELEETCINEPDLRFNIPKNMEESKVKFEYKPTFTAQSKRKQEQQDEGYGEQDVFGKADVGDPRLRWYTVTELSKFICELCAREMQMSKSKVLGPNSKLRELECGHERYILQGLSRGRKCTRASSRNAWWQSPTFKTLWWTSTTSRLFLSHARLGALSHRSRERLNNQRE